MPSDPATGAFNFGLHYIIELVGCDPEKIKTVTPVKEILLDAAIKSNATILKEYYHQFEPEGVSAVILIAESHFTIHTWPEEGYAAVDIFTCGKEMDAGIAIEEMKTRFRAKEAQVKKVVRGPEKR